MSVHNNSDLMPPSKVIVRMETDTHRMVCVSHFDAELLSRADPDKMKYIEAEMSLSTIKTD